MCWKTSFFHGWTSVPDITVARNGICGSIDLLSVNRHRKVIAIDIVLSDRTHFDHYITELIDHGQRYPGIKATLRDAVSYCSGVIAEYPKFLDEMPKELLDAVNPTSTV